MNTFAVIFFLLNAAALLVVPRRWAAFPLLIGACYMTLGQGIQLGPFHFPVIRLIMLVGFVRVLVKGEKLPGGFNSLDKLMIAWGSAALLSSFFHGNPSEALVFRLGLTFNCLGVYFLFRVFCQELEDVRLLVAGIGIVLLPVALEMIQEKLTGFNRFSVLGGVPVEVMVREGRLRAQGPFSHPILAGTVGAVCLPLMAGIWKHNRIASIVGATSCMAMVYCSSSSGPLMSVLVAICGVLFWKWRHLTSAIRVLAFVAYVGLELTMKAPAYYLIARVDLAGGSTGYHRAALIEAAIKHFKEWGLAGTDYTRHWMPYGVTWSEDHCDITNQFILYGVIGGFLLMVLFIALLVVAFRYVGQALAVAEAEGRGFFVWVFGVGLFAQTATCISVAYFDQSFLFLYLNLSIIAALKSVAVSRSDLKETDLETTVTAQGDPVTQGTS